jgi:FixJ family two-component response regulator
MGTPSNTYVAVIDDETSICASMSRLLRLADFQPVIYSSAEAFLADAKRPQFDCLLLDIRLEGMSGLDLFRQLAEQETHPPVIFITASEDPDMRAQAEAMGCAAFFSKTSPGAEIIEAVRRAASSGGQ